MKSIIFARVSSKEQRDGYSIQTQTDRLKEYCINKGLELLKTFQIVESSTRGDRKEFKSMLKFAGEQKETVALVVLTIDRLQRSFKEYTLINDLIDNDNIEIHFVNENKIISKNATSNDKMMWNFGILMAQNYTDVLSEKVRWAFQTKRENGEWSGKAPLGYINAKDDINGKRTIIIDKERAFLVKKLFVEYSSENYSISELTDKAKNWGLRNKESSKPLSTSQIHHIIKNPFYYGQMLSVGKLYDHIYPTLIDKQTWNKCQQIRTNRSRTDSPRKTNKPFIFRGLIKCATSERIVTSDIKKGKYVYLICRDPNNKKKKLFVPETIVLEEVRKVFQSIRIEDQILKEIAEHLKEIHNSEKEFQGRAVIELQKENNKIQSMLDKLLDLLLAESITQNDYDKKFQQLKNKQFDINERIKSYLKADESFKITVNTILSIASKAYEIFESSNIEQKRKLINYVFSNIRLNGLSIEYDLRKPFDMMVDCQTYSDYLGH